MRPRTFRLGSSGVVLALGGVVPGLLAGCASVPVREAVPLQLVSQATVSATQGEVRIWGDASAEEVDRFLAIETDAVKAKWEARLKSGKPLTNNMLVLSGGADDGAYGAGLLVGWGEAGGRPEFDLVTGISAGALIAPMVFVGPEYDRKLATVFTEHAGNEIYEASVLEGLFGGSSLADSTPLRRLIEKYADARLMQRVAEERQKGRLLIIGTTNIDAQRPVFWDMGRIAAAGTPEALALFQSVLLASASIPGVFPPVHVKVAAGGKAYEELHVDGGTTRQLFLSPGAFSFKKIDRALGRQITRNLYIIRNGKIGPEYEATKETALGLSQRSLTTVLKNQAIGDLIRVYEKARRDGLKYHLVSIPDDFSAERPAPFTLSYMRPLYERGLGIGRGTIPWQETPPSL